MDVIKITHPTTWAGEDDPADYMCLLSLREAINERASYVGMSWNCPPILPHLPYNRDVMVAMQTALYRLIPYFVNHEFKDYAKDLSDFPRMWSLSDLVTAEHNIALMPSPGSLPEVWSEWLKAMKYIIGKLTHIPFSNYGGEVVTGSGSIHDPPFDESISEAIKKALENKTKHTFEELPLTFGTWSGNTHYSHNSEADTKDGYCGYAELNAIHITKIAPPRPDTKFTMLFKTYAAKPERPCSYSRELEKSVFGGVSGIAEGISDFAYTYNGEKKLNIWFGSDEKIPKNATKPHSDFPDDEDDDSPTIRRSTKTGFEARLYCMLDLSPGLKFK